MIKIKKGWFGTIKYKGKSYKKVSTESQIGDIAVCLGKSHYTTKGSYYLLVECHAPRGFKGIIADDNDPMGIHDDLGHFAYYRTKGIK